MHEPYGRLLPYIETLYTHECIDTDTQSLSKVRTIENDQATLIVVSKIVEISQCHDTHHDTHCEGDPAKRSVAWQSFIVFTTIIRLLLKHNSVSTIIAAFPS